MTPNMTVPPHDFDLSDCAQEPIQRPGSIQPHGVLLVLAEPDLEVIHSSQNVTVMLGRELEDVLGHPVDALLGPELARLLRDSATNPSLERTPLFVGKGQIPSDGGGKAFDAIVHRSDGSLILELEPAPADELATFRNLYPLARTFLAALDDAHGAVEACQLAAEEVRRIIGFDRVLIYRFDRDWNGTVIAEDRNEALPSYLDLRFPASDIPEQARNLYRDSRVRLIADSRYVPVPIIPAGDPPLDLSFAALRSVSPIHLEYMVNMGTAASMSISILHHGRLWGLIACHHKTPKVVPYEARTAADFLGQVLSTQVTAKQQRDEYEHRIARKAVQVKLLAGMTAAPDFVAGLAAQKDDLLELVEAQGAAILHEGQCTLLGATPCRKAIEQIADWLEREGRDDLFATESLALDLSVDASVVEVASGVLAIAISKIHRGYIFWFRPELVRTVTWGGDPNKSAETVEGGRIHPRKSFEAWKEIVRFRAAPWQAAEIEAAAELRNAIVGIVLRQAEERAQLSAELERSNRELEAFSYSVSHDLRAPFRHIVGYSEMLREEDDARLSDEGRRYLDTIVESAQYAGTLVDNLLAFARMGRTTIHPVPIDMNTMTREVVRVSMTEAGDRKIRWEIGHLPPVEGDLMMMRLAMANLVSNSVKYTRPRDEALIKIQAESRGGEVIFSVNDNGIGFDMNYADKLFGVFQRLHRMEDFEGTGIGLANVRRIISRHGGRTWGEGEVGRGATFYFSLPKLREEKATLTEPE
ncbi:ATP-binding protein [Tundrisphaera lichenicola]|uniref:ATP-binding protein n=1 Tax=Tundrisphaera lichenicola TaxID=2029860 RepID=UPI003EBFF587